MGQLTSKIFSIFRTKKPQDILMVGLDSVGKTTILYIIKDNTDLTTVPTIGFNLEECKIENTKFKLWDVGGQERIRHLWPTYLETSNGLVYVVDISNPDKFDDAVLNFKRMVEEKNVPILILLNKCDLVEEEKIIDQRRKMILSMCSDFLVGATFKEFVVSAKKDKNEPDKAYFELLKAFAWLSKEIQKCK